MIDLLGTVGSPVDVATLVVVVAEFRYGTVSDLEERLEAAGAYLAVLADDSAVADGRQVRADLDVDERDVDAARVMVCDGNGNGGEQTEC